jgi:FkbM family methyltransferase
MMKKFLHKGWCVAIRLRAATNTFVRVLRGKEYARRSYSQYGEDMVLQAVFARYPSTYPGFYVDVGAHHPLRFSNTRFFYELGWSGICVDPLPGSTALFAKWRPRDLFLQAGVADTEGEMTYFMFAEPALNTFSEKIAGENAANVTVKETVKVYPLCRILADHLKSRRTIDFLSLDVEGLDLEVLRSNDWTKYRPCIVLIEEKSRVTLAEVKELDSAIFMKQQGYHPFARTPGALFFMDTRSLSYDGGSYLRFTDITPAEGEWK